MGSPGVNAGTQWTAVKPAVTAAAACNRRGVALESLPPLTGSEAIKEDAMAKGQMRSNKEKKKPKADHNKKKKGGAPTSPFAVGQGSGQPGQNPFGKKGP